VSAAGWAEEVTRRWLRLAEEVQRRLGTGQPLPPAVQTRYARRLGFDVGVATVHRGPFAAGLAGALGAAAFSAGGHVAGGEAALDPESTAGAALLGHELVHVAQQTAPPPAAPVRSLAPPRLLARRGGAAMPGAAMPGGASPAGAFVQRQNGDGVGGEASALAAEAAILRAARQRRAARPPPDTERLADLVYERLVDAARAEAARMADTV
jgi:hypothetical protein